MTTDPRDPLDGITVSLDASPSPHASSGNLLFAQPNICDSILSYLSDGERSRAVILSRTMLHSIVKQAYKTIDGETWAHLEYCQTPQDRFDQYLSYTETIDLVGSLPYGPPSRSVLDLFETYPRLTAVAWSDGTMTRWTTTAAVAGTRYNVEYRAHIVETEPTDFDLGPVEGGMDGEAAQPMVAGTLSRSTQRARAGEVSEVAVVATALHANTAHWVFTFNLGDGARGAKFLHGHLSGLTIDVDLVVNLAHLVLDLQDAVRLDPLCIAPNMRPTTVRILDPEEILDRQVINRLIFDSLRKVFGRLHLVLCTDPNRSAWPNAKGAHTHIIDVASDLGRWADHVRFEEPFHIYPRDSADNANDNDEVDINPTTTAQGGLDGFILPGPIIVRKVQYSIRFMDYPLVDPLSDGEDLVAWFIDMRASLRPYAIMLARMCGPECDLQRERVLYCPNTASAQGAKTEVKHSTPSVAIKMSEQLAARPAFAELSLGALLWAQPTLCASILSHLTLRQKVSLLPTDRQTVDLIGKEVWNSISWEAYAHLRLCGTPPDRVAQYLSYVRHIDLAGSLPYSYAQDVASCFELVKAGPLLRRIDWIDHGMQLHREPSEPDSGDGDASDVIHWRLERSVLVWFVRGRSIRIDAYHRDIVGLPDDVRQTGTCLRNLALDLTWGDASAEQMRTIKRLLVGPIATLTITEASAYELGASASGLLESYVRHNSADRRSVDRIITRDSLWTLLNAFGAVYKALGSLCDDVTYVILPPQGRTSHRPSPRNWPLLADVAPFVDHIELRGPHRAVTWGDATFHGASGRTKNGSSVDTRRRKAQRARTGQLRVTYDVFWDTRGRAGVKPTSVLGNRQAVRRELMPWVAAISTMAGPDAILEFGSLTLARRDEHCSQAYVESVSRQIHEIVLKLYAEHNLREGWFVSLEDTL